MNKLFILEGQSEGLLAVLQNDNSGKCPFFDAIHTEQLNKDHTFEFSVPANHAAAAHVKENNLVVFKDEDGEYLLFQIYKTQEEHNGLELVTRAYAEHSFFEMNDDIIEDLRTVNGTASNAMDDALSKSRFKKGIVADLGLRTTNFYYESAVSSIQKIIQTWGGELKKRVTFDGNKITGRFVDLLARRGADTGKRFEYTKDLLSIKRTVDASNVKTALYGRGKGEETETGGYSRRLTFADEVWNGSGLDPVDKPAGQEWVGDPEALEQFGRIDPETGEKVHRFGVFEDGQETDAAALLQKTWNALQGVNAPKVTYEMNVLDLETVSGLSHEKVRLGDTVFVIDKEFTPELRIEARVIEIKRDLANPENTEIILGNFLPMFTDLASRLKNIESKVDGKEGIWDEGAGNLGPIEDKDFADITPAKPTVTVTGAFSKVIIEWDADTSAYLKEYEVYVSTIPGFTPDASNLAARIVTSVFAYEGEPNQQYYVRVRGVNRAGTAGPFSDEKSAQTARIGSADLSDLLITAEKLAIGSITNDKLDRTSSNKIVIDSADIKNAAVGSAAIANLAVNTGHIQNLAVTNAKIANLAVDTAKIADLAVTNAKIGNISAKKITSDYLDVARIDVRAQLGANIATAEEGKYGYMIPVTFNGQTWYQYAYLDDWIYLMEETDSTKYNRPSPEEGDEIAFDFMLYVEATKTPSMPMTINVFFEDGTSWSDNFLLTSVASIPINAEKRVKFSRTIPQGAYSGKDPVHWECYFYNGVSGSKVYVRKTDVRIRLRGNLIVQGDIEAKNIKAWEGLNVNDQFIVDSNGNVTFAGSLTAGVEINSPNINSGSIDLVGLGSGIECKDYAIDTENETIVRNGYVSQTIYLIPGDWTKSYRETSMFNGSFISSVSADLVAKPRDTFFYYDLPYEYKYYPESTTIMPGLVDNEGVDLSGIAADTVPRLNGSHDESFRAYPFYIRADRVGIGDLSPMNQNGQLMLDIRGASSGDQRNVVISGQDSMHFRLIGTAPKYIDMHNKTRIVADSDMLQLVGETHCYMEFFKDGDGFSRAGYFGFGSPASDELALVNQQEGGNIFIRTYIGAQLTLYDNNEHRMQF